MLNAFRIPHPVSRSGLLGWLAVCLMASRTWKGVRLKLRFPLMTRAATPAESGQENDVPSAELYPELPTATWTPDPIAMISGLIRPSAVGPTALNDAREPDEVTAPAVMTLKPSAGAPSVL